jgi:26S proteasome regulatory subunit N4
MSAFAELKESLKLMMVQRDALEIEADAIHSELTSVGLNGAPPAGISSPLVDAEGYPRSDIDIINVKNKRRRLAEINTDHKSLMKRIEHAMHNLHTHFPDAPTTAPVVAPLVDSAEQSSLLPMAKLDEVLEKSPASEAGILENDILLRFGSVSSSTESFLSAVAQTVGKNVNTPINITVQRAVKAGDATKIVQLELVLTPKSWGGRGLLGCHLSPLPK